MKNLIFCAFAFKEGFSTSRQTEKKASQSTTEMYLKNIFVTLTSAKRNNPEDDVCLVTNYRLSGEWTGRLQKEHLLICYVGFDTFVIPSRYPWALAFYKLCALKAMTEKKEYDHILMIDADAYTVQSYRDLWKEADYGVMLYPVGHAFCHPDREIIRRDFKRFFPEEAEQLNIVHYGGEFVAGNRKDLCAYLSFCEKVYKKIKDADCEMQKNAGDETIWSIAAALAGKEIRIIGAEAYIYRFWTGDFYLVSTVTVSNPVCIWHIPNEKETGFLTLYKYYRKKGKFPATETAGKIFGIVKAKRPLNYFTLKNKIDAKMRKIFQWNREKK